MPDEYIDETGRLRVRDPRFQKLPKRARKQLAPDEYIDENGIARKNAAVRSDTGF